MEILALSILALAVSLLILYWGSKRVVRGASGLSSCLNISRVVVGTVFVAFVTALPELLSSLFAVGLGSSHLALGNIIGSNIYNIPLIIGICGLVGGGIKIKNSSISKECIFMMGLSLLMIVLLAVTRMVTWWMGAIFVSFYPSLSITLYAMEPAAHLRNAQDLNLAKETSALTCCWAAAL